MTAIARTPEQTPAERAKEARDLADDILLKLLERAFSEGFGNASLTFSIAHGRLVNIAEGFDRNHKI